MYRVKKNNLNQEHTKKPAFLEIQFIIDQKFSFLNALILQV